jgi:hypothetical protein
MKAIAAFGLLIATILPASAQERAPEMASGGVVVLRGTPPTNTSSQPLPPGPTNPISNGSAPSTPVSSNDWDTGGFDNRYDRSGLTPR